MAPAGTHRKSQKQHIVLNSKIKCPGNLFSSLFQLSMLGHGFACFRSREGDRRPHSALKKKIIRKPSAPEQYMTEGETKYTTW